MDQGRRFRNRSPFRARSMRQGGQFVPQQLGHTALYDAHLSSTATEVGDSSGNGRAAVAYAATTASPLTLTYATPRVWLSGVTDKVASASAAGPSTALDVRVAAALNDWTPAAVNVFAAQGTTVASASTFRFYLLAAGTVRLETSDGTTFTARTTTSTTGFTDGTIGALRATWRASDGRIQIFKKTTTEATAVADCQSNTGWTQIDTDLTGQLTNLAAVSNAYGFGGYGGAANTPMAGSFYYGQVSAAIDGAPTVACDPTILSPTGGTDTTGSLGLALTVTRPTSGRKAVVQSPVGSNDKTQVLAGTDDYATGPVAAIPALGAADACTLYCVTRPFATLAVNMTFFSTRLGAGAGVTLRMATATTVVADISDGTTTVTTPAVTITPGTRYALGVVIPATGGAYCFANNTAGGTVARTGNPETGGALTAFAINTPANFLDVQSRVPYAAVPRALTAGEIANLVTYYGGGV